MRSFCAGWTRAKTEMPLDARRELGVGQPLELAPVDRPRRRRARCRASARSASRSLVIAGHHDRPDARVAAARDRVLDLGARRVDLPDEPEQRRPGREAPRSRRALDLGALHHGEREHAQRPLGHASAAPRSRARGVVERHVVSARRSAAQVQHDLGGALEHDPRAPRRLVLGRHHLGGRVEGELGAPRVALRAARRARGRP